VTSKPELAEERSAAGQEKEKPTPVPPSTLVPPPTSTPTPDVSTERPAETQVTPKPEPAPAPPQFPPEAVPAAKGTTLVRPPAHEEQLRRVVRHEGIVRSTVSIQAPTYFELLSPENHKTINYLHVDKLGLKLNDYRGRRVIVTGEEAIDPRWPKTPVIEVETLELIP
jgi:hypothetical protein